MRRYACLEGPQAMHMKGTLVRQAAGSSYKLTEARLGGRLTRQDIHVVQVRVMHVVHVMHVMQMDGAACRRVVSCCSTSPAPSHRGHTALVSATSQTLNTWSIILSAWSVDGTSPDSFASFQTWSTSARNASRAVG